MGRAAFEVSAADEVAGFVVAVATFDEGPGWGCLGGLQTALAGVSLNMQAAFKSSKRLKSSLHFFNCGGAAFSGSLMGAMGCLKKPNNRKLYRLVLAFVL